MGFWSKAGEVGFKTAKFIGNAATVISNSVEQKAGAIKELKKEYELKSDEELMGIVKDKRVLGSDSTEKGVARSVLRERGYGNKAGS